MQIELLCVTKPIRGWVREACGEYEKRLRGQFNFHVKEIQPVGGQKTQPKHGGAGHRAKEAERLIAATPKSRVTVALDEKGTQITTRQFAELIDEWQHTAADVTFYIGGADGLDKRLLASVDRRISLSKLTLPHQFARLLFTEQLYRAVSILNNHPYHRD
ncbi:MAG: 23S rRNA (pseudouridine(1915)-N(3))-methyltransferase RlmH [Gammaproteobacteria bacterium]